MLSHIVNYIYVECSKQLTPGNLVFAEVVLKKIEEGLKWD